MIRRSEIYPAGVFAKTHGVNGEVTVSLDDAHTDIVPGQALVVDINGIYVPFFVETVRPKGADALLVKIEDVDTQPRAREFTGKTLYLLRRDRQEAASHGDDDNEEEGFYATDLVDFEVIDDADGMLIGRIESIDDSTSNVLFIVSRPDGSEVMIPVADEWITDIDVDHSRLTMSLPEGLI